MGHSLRTSRPRTGQAITHRFFSHLADFFIDVWFAGLVIMRVSIENDRQFERLRKRGTFAESLRGERSRFLGAFIFLGQAYCVCGWVASSRAREDRTFRGDRSPAHASGARSSEG